MLLRFALPLLLTAAGASALDPGTTAPLATTIKLATLVPDGSVWDKSFRKMGSEWKRDTDGRVQLRVYPSGAAGDEPDVLRKMRIGQLHAAALTVSGLAEIDPAFRVFEIPMYFADHAEALYVLHELTPVLKQRLEDKGFVLLHWGHVGWIHLFSTEPVASPDDLRPLKQFVWAGGPDAGRYWKQNGFNPVPLAVSDIPMGIETGLIEAFPSPPLSALAFQWYRSAPYMLDMGAAPYVGGTVITTRAWKKISAQDQKAMLAAGARTEASLDEDVPKQEREAIAEMEKRGLTVVKAGAARADWQRVADRFAKQMSATDVPADFFAAVEKHRREFRAKRAKD